MNWLTVTTTLIAAIAPSLISIITIYYQSKTNKENNELQIKLNKQSNDYQLMQKQLDCYYPVKISALNSYLSKLNELLSGPTFSQQQYEDYQLAMFNSCMYVCSETYQVISTIDELIKQRKLDVIEEKYFSILLKQIQIETSQYSKNN